MCLPEFKTARGNSLPFFLCLPAGYSGCLFRSTSSCLFFFYEIAVFPMYLLIVIWGWIQTREYAAMKLTLYLFMGSVVALVGALAMYWVAGQNTGVYTFDMLQLEKAGFSASFQNLWFLPVFFGFAVLGGIWPFHNWSPDGHVAAPTAVSMFHAGVLMKLGAFAALRVGIMLLPGGSQALVLAYHALCCGCSGLWGVHCLCSDGFQICDRLLLGFAYGTGDAGTVHPFA